MANKSNKLQNDPWKKRFYGTLICSIVLILGLLVGGGLYTYSLKKNTITNSQTKQIELFETLAKGYLQSAEIDVENPYNVNVIGHGVSENDELYIDFQYSILNKEKNAYGDWINGRVYFQKTSTPGHYAEAFTFENK